mmetsp:Transcript_1073/g.2919  ORF Transcript_1073/g.2919 Transcript_1073/m.2919 type:complete len:281 (-) Transcript_1073:1252-2094(-)
MHPRATARRRPPEERPASRVAAGPARRGLGRRASEGVAHQCAVPPRGRSRGPQRGSGPPLHAAQPPVRQVQGSVLGERTTAAGADFVQVTAQAGHYAPGRVANHDPVHAGPPLLPSSAKRCSDTCRRLWDLPVRHEQHVGIPPEITVEPLAAGAQDLLQRRAAVEGVLQELQEAVQAAGGQVQVELLELLPGGEGEQTAPARTAVGFPHALEDDGLCEDLRRPAHAAHASARVEAQDYRAVPVGRAGLLRAQLVGRRVKPAGAVVADQRLLHPASMVQGS